MADLEIVGVKKSFKKTPVLSDVTLMESAGQCIGILGRNGSGKSTLLEILCGILPADGGSFSFMGMELLGKKKDLRGIVGFVPQGTPLFDELTARDHLLFRCGRAGLSEFMKSDLYAKLGIDEFIGKRVGKMSGGMKKRLSIAMALTEGQRLLLLDEPSAALDLPCKAELHGWFGDYTKNGGTILIVTHDLQEIEVCDKLYILKEGRLDGCPKGEDLSSIAKRMA